MELVVTLSEFNNIHMFMDYGVSILLGGEFSSRFHYSLDEIKEAVKICREKNAKVYISIDTFISENEISFLYEYMEEIEKLKVDGIYFQDLAVYTVAKSYGMEKILIYDGGPMIMNSADIEAYLGLGIDSVVLGRELTLDEVTDILRNHAHELDMQLFGHLRMSTSKRMFLSNYFNYLNLEYNPKDRDDLKIIEEQRDYALPIKETKFGTNIYTDYIFECIEELPYLKRLVKRCIIDDAFLPFELALDAVRAYYRAEERNAKFIATALHYKHHDLDFSKGYFYTPTNIVKENEKD